MVTSLVQLLSRIVLVGTPDIERATTLEQQHPTLILPPITVDSQPTECAECGVTVWLNKRQSRFRGEVQVICWDCAHDRVSCERYTATNQLMRVAAAEQERTAREQERTARRSA